MRGELTRGKLTAALAVWAVAFGAVAWLLLGPVWAIAGVLVGPLVGLIVLAVFRVYATTDAAVLLRNDQPDEAIAQLRREMASWRALARIWPSQFRDALASRLIVQSGALPGPGGRTPRQVRPGPGRRAGPPGAPAGGR